MTERVKLIRKLVNNTREQHNYTPEVQQYTGDNVVMSIQKKAQKRTAVQKKTQMKRRKTVNNAQQKATRAKIAKEKMAKIRENVKKIRERDEQVEKLGAIEKEIGNRLKRRRKEQLPFWVKYRKPNDYDYRSFDDNPLGKIIRKARYQRRVTEGGRQDQKYKKEKSKEKARRQALVKRRIRKYHDGE